MTGFVCSLLCGSASRLQIFLFGLSEERHRLTFGSGSLQWIWKQINQAISGSRHFSLTLPVPAAPPLSCVSALLQDPFNLEQTKESGKRYSLSLCGPYSAILLHCFLCSLLLLLIFISFSLPCFWAWEMWLKSDQFSNLWNSTYKKKNE